MVFFFRCEENPLVTNETHVAASGVVAFHGNSSFLQGANTPCFFEPEAHYDAPTRRRRV